MMTLTQAQFPDFFRELYGHPPYSWQTRLMKRAVEGEWPGAIDLPTGSGKTACIDIAIFALACQASRPVAERTAPRRVFFCVNRRVIVDEAHQRARTIAESLRKAERDADKTMSVLARVAANLRQIAGTAEDEDSPPLDVLELRGGIYRDNRWARSAAQPTVVCTTIDQLGSRLLFRGYGVSPSAAPIQAALIAYDSLVLLDEAHISPPFQETLEQVRRYLDPRKWAAQSVGPREVIIVPMTATPSKEVNRAEILGLDDLDLENPSLSRRLNATKTARLTAVPKVPEAIVEKAAEFAKQGFTAIGVIVNRIVTARRIYEQLREKHTHARVELVIGSMRPLDRDKQAKTLADHVGPGEPRATQQCFIVATQCLEVGADYDFDALVTECASLDALRQRFGRLNRGGRAINAAAAIVVKDTDAKPEEKLDNDNPIDPIYGNALARTWNWLISRSVIETTSEIDEQTSKRSKTGSKKLVESRTIDFGINAFQALLDEHAGGLIPIDLLAPSAKLQAPIMLPAYVDFWCQTSPVPAPDPEVALFIHGSREGEPDVQVCWRADLLENEYMSRDNWCDVVALLHPTAAECMSVPLSRVRRWLANSKDDSPDRGDLLEFGVRTGDDENGADKRRDRPAFGRRGVLWRGISKSTLIESPDDPRPGDTLVLPLEGKGCQNDLGFVPEPRPRNNLPTVELSAGEPPLTDEPHPHDVAEAAFERARDKRVLRIHPSLFTGIANNNEVKALLDRVADIDDPPTAKDMRELMREAARKLTQNDDPLRAALEYFASPKNPFICEAYPDERGVVLTARKRLGTATSWFLPTLDDGDDVASRIVRRQRVTLADHTSHVVEQVEKNLETVHTSPRREAYRIAAERHDWGKADERFQAWLRGTDRNDAWLHDGESPALLAKSTMAQSPSARDAARERAGLPRGFRHELLSVQLADRAGFPEIPSPDYDLILHFIAAHHGYCRPFAQVALDENPPEVEYAGITLTSRERAENPPHRLDSGIADRFWTLTRRYGWWGLAYLESILRLADQQASADEDSGKLDTQDTLELAEVNA